MKKGFIVAIAVAIMSFILAATMGVYLLVTGLDKEEKFIVHVGVETSTSTNKTKIEEICKKHTTGDMVYTSVTKDVGGAYIKDGATVVETKFVYTFFYTNEETVNAIAEEIVSTIEGCTVLVEKVECAVEHSRTGVFDKVATEETAETA